MQSRLNAAAPEFIPMRSNVSVTTMLPPALVLPIPQIPVAHYDPWSGIMRSIPQCIKNMPPPYERLHTLSMHLIPSVQELQRLEINVSNLSLVFIIHFP